MTDEVTAQLVEIFQKTYKDLEPEARDAIVVKIVERVNRLSAQRDGWQAIATELLKIAFGDDNVLGDGDIPPVELIEMLKTGVPTTFEPALEMFWAALTRKHAKARLARGVSPEGMMMFAVENLESGDTVVVDAVGNVRRARPGDDTGEGEE